MAGLHGKNAQLLVASNTTVVASGTLVQVGTSDVYQIASAERNWQFNPDNTSFKIEYQRPAGSGDWYTLDLNHPGINYAAGAVQIPAVKNAFVTAKVFYRSDLTDVTHKMSQNKSWDVTFESDEVDATVMGELWGTSLPGIPKFSGTIDGLYLNSAKYQRAVVNASGINAARIVRFRPDTSVDTYFQGAVRFKNWSLSAAFDGPIEETLEFDGQGPLDAIVGGSPYFGPFI